MHQIIMPLSDPTASAVQLAEVTKVDTDCLPTQPRVHWVQFACMELAHTQALGVGERGRRKESLYATRMREM